MFRSHEEIGGLARVALGALVLMGIVSPGMLLSRASAEPGSELAWEKVSRSETHASSDPVVSADGSVVGYVSQGADIVSGGDTNGQSDCFVAYVPEWTTERASTSSTDTELQYGGSFARIDDGGTQFVFTASDDDVMTPYTVNGLSQAYVRDLDTWSLERASLNGGTPPASVGAYGTDISGDGSRVALQSDDDGFYSGDNDAIRNLYVRVRGDSPVTQLVTPSTLNGGSSGLLLSESGMTGVFVTNASNITTDTNGTGDVVLWKDGVGLTVLSAVNGYAGNGLSGDDGYAIDGSGSVVAFGSRASNLVAGDTNGKADVFVWREGFGLERMAVGSGDTLGNGHSRLLALSNDGRFVLYSTEATNAPSGAGVYLRDRQAVAPRYVAASATDGALGDGGEFLVISTSEVLLAGDLNSVADIYLARADFAAPTTSASVESSYNAGGGPVISAVDANAVTVYWRYNGEATQSAPAPATAVRSEAGTSTLVYWGVDSEGNTEKPKSVQVVVGDTRAPETEAVGNQASYDGTATISLVATDKAIGTGQSGVKRIEWWTDSNLSGGTIWAASGQVEVPYIGDRTLYFSAEDNRGNVEETGSVTFRVNDVDPPVVTFGGSADDRYSDTAYIYVIADDGWYGGTLQEVEYSHDGILWQSVTEDPDGMSDTRWMVQVTGTGLGAGTLYARSTDAAGNASGTRTYAYEIYDGVEPECDLEAPGGLRQGGQVRLVATDPGSSPSGVKRIHWTYNAGVPQSFEGTSALVTVTEYGAGNDFTIWAEDNAGNTGPIAYKSPWVADGVAPSVELTVNASGTRADFSASDPQPGHDGMLLLRWTIDDDPGVYQVAVSNGGAAWQDFSVEGTRTIRVWAMDPAGNEGTTETATFWCQAGGGDPDPDPDPDPPAGGFQIAGGRQWLNSNELPITSNVSGVTQMRFKAPGDADWRDWTAYATQSTLTVDAGETDGGWTVYAQYRDDDGAEADVDTQATIGIDRVKPHTGSNANEGRTFTFPEQIVLVPDDFGASGVDQLWYRVGDGEPVKDQTVIWFDPGTYELAWWAADHAGNVEDEHTATVRVAGPVLTTTSKSATISYGGTYYLNGRVTIDTGWGLEPYGEQQVMLQYLSGTTWIDTGIIDTVGGDGVYTFAVKPTSKRTYRACFAVQGVARRDMVSTAVAVTPRASVGTPVAPSTMYVNKAKTVYGSLKPRHTAGTYPVRIYRYRYENRKWRSYGYTKAKASNLSTYTKYSASVKLTKKGKWRLRAYHPADSGHPATWSAKYDYVTVK